MMPTSALEIGPPLVLNLWIKQTETRSQTPTTQSMFLVEHPGRHVVTHIQIFHPQYDIIYHREMS